MTKRNSDSIRLIAGSTLIFLMAMPSAFAENVPYDVQQSCLLAAKQELGLKGSHVFSRKMGVRKVENGEYAFYLNVNKRLAKTKAGDYAKVYCRSAGFAKVREVSVSEGQWAFVAPGDADENQQLALER